MSFFKNLFSKGNSKDEPFIPTPTQSIPGLEPIVVHAVEHLYTDQQDQQIAFEYLRNYKEKFRKTTAVDLLSLLAYTQGNVEQLPNPVLWSDGRFNHDEINPIFSFQMKKAEDWVRSITKTQAV